MLVIPPHSTVKASSFEKDKALLRRFQNIFVEEPSLEETIYILERIKSTYEEYHNIKFHINEIETLQIVDTNNTPAIIDDLPIRNAKVLFLLKSGRTKTCYVRKLTKRKYKWLLKLLNN